MKEGLNLLPSVAKFQAARMKLKKKVNFLMIIFLGAWVLFMIVVFGWLWFNNSSLNKAKNENAVVLKQYQSSINDVVLSRKNKYQANLVGKVLSERFEYGLSIEKTTKMFSENVIIDSFEINTKKQFILKGILSNGANMIEVEEKVRDINLGLIPDFKSAKLNSVSIDANGWTFEMEVSIK